MRKKFFFLRSLGELKKKKCTRRAQATLEMVDEEVEDLSKPVSVWPWMVMVGQKGKMASAL